MAARTQVATVEETSLDRVKASAASKVMVLAPPWLIWPIIGGLGQTMHTLWGRESATAAWSAIGLTLASCFLSLVTWLVSHQRGWLGRGSATATTGAVSMWITVCSVAGFAQSMVLWLFLVGGLVTCAAWNIRSVIRHKHGMSGITDPLAFLFEHSKDKAGMSGARMATKNTSGRKVEAAMAVPDGKTVADVQKKTENMEAAMAMPPNSLNVSPNIDRADLAHVSVSDPRIMRTPIPWPGPSRPGGSIAEPLRPGIWQDGEDVLHVIIGSHLQFMGASGSGKSLGGAWNYLAEIITRYDAVVLGADITKGEQTLGPLRPALHRFETTPAGVRSLVADIQGEIKPRTDWLTERGYADWAPGCGLSYWVCWWEEVPDIFDAIGDKGEENFLKIGKALRSAGGTLVLSLQRSDWTQMKTLLRGQLAHACFGVNNSDDAAFGLSDAQDDAGARPELWGTKPEHRGSMYLDAPSIPAERIAMPLRTFGWLRPDGQPDPDALRAHALQWPAESKTIDKFTKAITTGRPPAGAAVSTAGPDNDDPDDEQWTAEGALDTADPDPAVQAGMDDAIEDDPDDQEWQFTRPAPAMSHQEARAALLERIAQWTREGRTDFTTGDFSDIWAAASTSRQWAQRHLRKLRDEGVLGFDDETQRHLILAVAEPVA